MAKIEKVLEDLYMNPRKPSSLGGVERLFKAAKLAIPALKKEQVVKFLEQKFAYSQHKQIARKFSKRSVIATAQYDVYQMDIADMQKFSAENDEFRYLLVVIDCFSKYAFASPLKNKTPTEVIRGLLIVFKQYGLCAKIFSDSGKEFKNALVKAFLKECSVWQWFSSNDETKAQTAERFTQTLKKRLWMYMTEKKWISIY